MHNNANVLNAIELYIKIMKMENFMNILPQLKK